MLGSSTTWMQITWSVMLRQILETSIGTSTVSKKTILKRRGGTGITDSEIEQPDECNGQFTDVFKKTLHSEVPFHSRSAPFKRGVMTLLKCLSLMSFIIES